MFKSQVIIAALGSSTQNIVLLLSKALLKPVILATLTAIPIGYYAINNWLESFVYRTSMPWWVFAVAACISLGIAFVKVSFNAVNAPFPTLRRACLQNNLCQKMIKWCEWPGQMLNGLNFLRKVSFI